MYIFLIKLKNYFILFISIYFFTCHLYSKTEYIKCNSLIIKIKKPLVGFNKAYVKVDNKWKNIDSFMILENRYVLYALKNNQKKCYNNNCRVDIKISKDIGSSRFFEFESVVSNNFCQIDGSNKCFKRDKGKNLQKGHCYNIDYKE